MKAKTSPRAVMVSVVLTYTQASELLLAAHTGLVADSDLPAGDEGACNVELVEAAMSAIKAAMRANAPTGCDNHPGSHRDWRQIADEREGLLEVLRRHLAWYDGAEVDEAELIAATRAAITKAEEGES